MRTLLFPLFALALAAPSAFAGSGGAFGGLEDMAPEGHKAKVPEAARKAVYDRSSWAALKPAEWRDCGTKLEASGKDYKKGATPVYSAIGGEAAEFQTASVAAADGGSVHFLCAAGHWLKVGDKLGSVSVSGDGRELVLTAPKAFYARLRAQDLLEGSGPHDFRPMAWMRADLFLETEASNPIELFLEPRTGLAGNGVALAFESLANAGLLGDSAFKSAKARKAAEDWVNKTVTPGDGRAQARLYTRESQMATATGDVIKSGIELYFKRPMSSEPQRVSERALLKGGKR